MGYLNKICKLIRRLFTISKLNQHPTKGKKPLSTSLKDIVHYCYYDTHIFHHSNFTISNAGGIKFRTFPLYSTLWVYWSCTPRYDEDFVRRRKELSLLDQKLISEGSIIKKISWNFDLNTFRGLGVVLEIYTPAKRPKMYSNEVITFFECIKKNNL